MAAKCRRELTPQHSEARLNWALITVMIRHLTGKHPGTALDEEVANDVLNRLGLVRRAGIL